MSGQIPRPPLDEAERFAVAGLLTSLMVLGTQSKQKLQAIERLFDELALSEAARRTLRELDRQTANPFAFAAGIRSADTRAAIVGDLLTFALIDGRYDAREREGLKRVAAALRVEWALVQRAELAALNGLVRWEAAEVSPTRAPSPWRKWKIASAVVAGAAALAISGGLAAPALGGALGAVMGLSGAAATSAGLAALGGGSLAAGGLGMAGGTAVLMGGLGVVGGARAGKAMHARTGAIEEFQFAPLGGRGLHTILAIPGFLSQHADLEQAWRPLDEVGAHAARYVLRWESQHLLKLGQALLDTTATHVVAEGAAIWARRATRGASRLLLWPALVVDAIGVIDNPWHVAADRAEKAGRELAAQLAGGTLGRLPVTLVGFSLGGRVIAHCLRELATQGHQGLVEDAILMGAAVTPQPHEWRAMRDVVAGRLVNVYSSKDWVLAYLYRAAQLETDAAGLGPVEYTGVCNVDVSDLANGHLCYPKVLEAILARVGIDRGHAL